MEQKYRWELGSMDHMIEEYDRHLQQGLSVSPYDPESPEIVNYCFMTTLGEFLKAEKENRCIRAYTWGGGIELHTYLGGSESISDLEKTDTEGLWKLEIDDIPFRHEIVDETFPILIWY